MRVGLVLDRFDRRLGGVEQWTAQLADHLLARGHEIHVVAREIAPEEQRPGLVAHPLPSRPTRMAQADEAAPSVGVPPSPPDQTAAPVPPACIRSTKIAPARYSFPTPIV